MDLVYQDRVLKEIVGGEGENDRREDDPLESASREVANALRVRNIHLMQRMLERDDEDHPPAREKPLSLRESGLVDLWKVVNESVADARKAEYEARKDALSLREREAGEDNKLAGVLLKELVGLVKEQSKREEKPKDSDITRVIGDVLRDPNHPLAQVVSPILRVLVEGVQMRVTPPDFRTQIMQSRDLLDAARQLAGGVDSESRRARLEDRKLDLVEERIRRREEREERREQERRKLEETRLNLLGTAIGHLGQIVQNMPAIIMAFRAGQAGASAPDEPLDAEPYYEDTEESANG